MMVEGAIIHVYQHVLLIVVQLVQVTAEYLVLVLVQSDVHYLAQGIVIFYVVVIVQVIAQEIVQEHVQVIVLGVVPGHVLLHVRTFA